MPENINRKKEEVISRETAGKIPWKYLTIILAGILLLGAIWMVANSFVTQTPAKTSTDLMNILSKSGGDKSPPVVNGTAIPSPTEKKGQDKGITLKTSEWTPINKGNNFVIPGFGETRIGVSQTKKMVQASVFRQNIDADPKDPKKYQIVSYSAIKVKIKLKTETGVVSSIINYGINENQGPFVSNLGEYDRIIEWQPEIELLPYVPPVPKETPAPVIMQ